MKAMREKDMLHEEATSLAAARNLVRFAARAQPDEAQDRALMAIIDTLGVTIAGSAHEACRILAETILPDVPTGPSALLGGDMRVGVLDAALLNGTAAHMLDYDDSNSDLFGHLSVAILPPLLALAERERASGKQLVHAFLCGYEAGCRFGNAVSRFQYTHGWHPTATVGIFAAVAANSVLIGMDEQRVAMAIGIAAQFASGIKSNFGSMTKPLGVGHASRNALLAVLLAERGFTSGERSLDHHHGYFSVFNQGADNFDALALTSPWVSDVKILDKTKGVKQKRYPCCFAIAPGLDGILALREKHQLTPDSIDAIQVAVHPIRYPHINVPDPKTPLSAKFSMNYCAARALVTGRVMISDFEDGPALADPATRSLMARTRLVEYDHDNLSGADVSITTVDGCVLTHRIDAAQGATYSNPLTPDMLRRKFSDCVSRRLGPGTADPLWTRLIALPECPDVSALTATMMQKSAVPKRDGLRHG